MSLFAFLKLDHLKFRQQLILAFCLGIFILAPITSFIIGTVTNGILIKQLHEQGQQIAQTLAAQSKLALLYESDYAAEESVSFVSGFPDLSVLDIRTADGKRLFMGELAETQISNIDYAQIYRLKSYEHSTEWIIVAPVYSVSDLDDNLDISGEENSDNETLLGYVTVSMSKHTLTLLQQKAFQTNFILSFFIALVASFALARISSRITKPIEKLSNAMKLAGDGETSIRSEVKGQPDITVMQQAFNTMMTELEKRENELKRARDNAVETARIKGEFAANVTHELRTPMNAVLGMMDLLADSKLSPSQAEYVDVARSSGESLLSLIEDILDFSKIDSGKMRVVAEQVNLKDLIEDIIRLLASQALTKDVDLGYFISRDVPGQAEMDRSRVQQVLINLIGNAIKFTETGEVSLTVYLSDEPTRRLQFEVRDSGIGISSDDQEKIFEAFTQADASTTREYSGTGLGLTISKQIVELMGGEIGLRSQIGSGSTFWFSLPCSSSTAPASSELYKQPKSSTQVMLIARSEINRQFAKQIFFTQGIECTVSGTYLDAATEIKRYRENNDHLDFLVIDEDTFYLHQAEFQSLFGNHLDLGKTSVAILVNPFRPSKIDKTTFSIIQKPLLSSSFRDFFNNPKAKQIAELQTKYDKSAAAKVPKILVVDDNRVNQQVAKEMLHKINCKTDVAGNGKQALELTLKVNYDLILMDCNMPVMDGYESAREIRKLEGAARMPIIAMTANNSEEEKQKCKLSGMNGFLAKPLRLNALKTELAEWLPAHALTNADVPDTGAHELTTPTASYDAEFMNELFGSVGDVVYRMLEAFIEDAPVYMDSLKTALAAQNAKQVRELAHTLKGSAANFGAHQFVETAQAIEQLAQHNQLNQCDLYIGTLVNQFAMLREDFENDILKTSSTDAGELEASHTLLIVDDDRTTRMALKDIFKGRQYETLEANNGSQAVDICRRNIPDIILMDAIMPESDGFEACKAIRHLPGCADIPVLIITSLNDEDAIVRAFASGATDFITKPLHFTVLKERVSRLIKANRVGKKVKELAYHDALTGLPNRARLMQELRVMLDRAQLDSKRAAVLFLDLDHFKNINDSLGHNVGDLLLKVVADRLRGCVRETDFIARLGGDEFTVVLENVESEETVSKVAKTICEALNEPFVFLQQRMFVSASIGISMFPEDASDVNTLLKHADLAMFKAKNTRNHFSFYQSGMEDQIAHRLEVEQELRAAIDNDELVLHFQPQYAIDSASIIAAETLVRWNHPSKGLLGPDQFIPIAEESGLITDLTRWVIGKTVQQVAAWETQGFEIKLSVNLSGKDLETTGQLVEHLAEIAERYQLTTSLLELEITESILMSDPETSRAELLELKSMGFTLAIDDFGTGYSSLNYLKNLPVDSLKIDRVFVKELEENVEDRSIVKGIIALADSLGLQTIAEGVETQEQLEILQGLGCNIIQGYLISKPLPINLFEARYKDHFLIENNASERTSL